MKQTYNNDLIHKNILIICTGNSCRSQIAEGFLKKLIPLTNVFSAGIETHGVNERVIGIYYSLKLFVFLLILYI